MIVCPGMAWRFIVIIMSASGLRNWVAAKASTDPPAQPGSSQNPKEDDLPKGEPVTLFRSLRDGPRAVDQLLLAPRYILP